MLRHRVTAAMREFLDGEGFVDIETPMLARSTPEGARDFLVPSSQQQGSFYALPQSPQLFKQLLMVAGFERYYQVARCFRDEATRADRQAEFTQLDVEMSFVDGEDVIEVNERLLAHVFGRVGGPEIELPMQRMCYDEAMGRFGTDRPDLRFGLELVDLGDALSETEFKVFRSALEGGGSIRGINAGRRELPRSELDGLISRAQELGAKGLVWAFREGEGWRSPTAKFLSEAELADLNRRLGAEEGDLLLLVADQRPVTDAVLGQMRIDLAERFGLIDESEHRLVWIVDWPLMEWNEGERRWDSLHHPFTAPAGEFDPENPGAARALAYDVVWNGQELGGGSIRINRAEVQKQVFAALGIDAETAEARFGFLLEALRYGAPPHGGIAYGVDRIVQRLSGAETIRDVIAFPKTASGFDLLTGAPAPVEDLQLRDLGISVHQRKLAGPLTWRSGTGFHAGGARLPAPDRHPSSSTTPASTAGRWCATSATSRPRGPGTRRWSRPTSRPCSRPTGRSTASAAATSPCGSPASAGARPRCTSPTSTGTRAEEHRKSHRRPWPVLRLSRGSSPCESRLTV